MKRIIVSTLAAFAFLTFATQSFAGLITFEDLVGPGDRQIFNAGEDQTVSDGSADFLVEIVTGQISFEDAAHSFPIPKNGTDTMSVNGFQFSTINLSRSDGSLFDLLALDLAAWPNATSAIVRISDGSSFINLSLTNSFQTYSLGWTGLSSVTFTNLEIENAWTVDNIVTAAVPEPGTLALFGIGLLGMGLVRRRKI